MIWIPGPAGHLFTGQESQVYAAVRRFLREEMDWDEQENTSLLDLG